MQVLPYVFRASQVVLAFIELEKLCERGMDQWFDTDKERPYEEMWEALLAETTDARSKGRVPRVGW